MRTATQSFCLESCASLVLAMGLCLLSGCTLATDTAIRLGLGKSCASDADCAGAICQKGTILTDADAGLCSTACASSSDCLEGLVCAASFCQVPMSVGLTIPSGVADAWSQTYAAGVSQAVSQLPYAKLDRQFSPTPLMNSIDSLRTLTQPNHVVIGSQLEYLPNLSILGVENPTKHFLGVSTANPYTLPDSPSNLGQVYLHTEEAYFVAGRLAAKSAAKRLGIISGLIGPESIRNVNAFALGARQEKPGIVIEVRHIGYYADTATAKSYSYQGTMYFREEYLARLLFEGGAEVIMDMSHQNDRASKLLQQLNGTQQVLSMISHVSFGTGDLPPGIESTVLAGVLENWGAVYVRILEQLHRQKLSASARLGFELQEGEQTPFTVSVNRNARTGIDRDDDAVFFIRDLANSRTAPYRKIWEGPWKANGQRDADGDGLPDAVQEVTVVAPLQDEEIARMCFFVEGVFEKATLNDPKSADQPAMVPGGLIPGSSSADSAAPVVGDSVDKLMLPVGQSANCRKNARWIYRSNG